MEVSPGVIVLISVLGSVLVFMVGLLITMVFGLKKDFDRRSETLFADIACVRKDVVEVKLRLGEMIPRKEHNQDIKAIDVKLDEHGEKILRLEIKVINGVAK